MSMVRKINGIPCFPCQCGGWVGVGQGRSAHSLPACLEYERIINEGIAAGVTQPESLVIENEDGSQTVHSRKGLFHDN